MNSTIEKFVDVCCVLHSRGLVPTKLGKKIEAVNKFRPVEFESCYANKSDELDLLRSRRWLVSFLLLVKGVAVNRLLFVELQVTCNRFGTRSQPAWSVQCIFR